MSIQSNELENLMNGEYAKFTPFTGANALRQAFAKFNDNPTLPLADKIMHKVNEDEIEIPANLAAEIKDFIERKRANGLPESFIREQVLEIFKLELI